MSHNNFEIVYINMQKDKDKHVLMSHFLGELGYPYRRSEGLDGNNHKFQIDPSIMINLNFKDHTGRNQTLGELGCAISHMDVWKSVVESGKTTLIFEDDAKSDATVELVCNVIDQARTTLEGTGYDLVYLGRQPLQPNKETGIELFPNFVEPRYSWLLHAYMITPLGAAKLLSHTNIRQNLITPDEWVPYAINKGYDSQLWGQRRDGYDVNALAYVDPNFFYQNRKQSSDTESSPEIFRKDLTKEKYVLATVATDINHRGFKVLFDSLETHHWDLESSYNLPDSSEWAGGDMEGPGGGHKVNMLKDFIDEYQLHDDMILIFVDGYDVLVNASPYNIIRRWVENFDTGRVTFAAEPVCWPDSDLVTPLDHLAAQRSPEETHGYNYLNSGTFMGRVGDIKELLERQINNFDDDQLYYQFIYTHTEKIELDYTCKLFQTMSNPEDDVQVDPMTGELTNTLHNTHPMILHGNGNEDVKKIFFGVAAGLDNIYNPKKFRYWV